MLQIPSLGLLRIPELAITWPASHLTPEFSESRHQSFIPETTRLRAKPRPLLGTPTLYHRNRRPGFRRLISTRFSYAIRPSPRALPFPPEVRVAQPLTSTAALHSDHLDSGTRTLLLVSPVPTPCPRVDRIPPRHPRRPDPETLKHPRPLLPHGPHPAPPRTHENEVRPLGPGKTRHHHHLPGSPAPGRSRVTMTPPAEGPPPRGQTYFLLVELFPTPRTAFVDFRLEGASDRKQRGGSRR